jgi:hypothetical protein
MFDVHSDGFLLYEFNIEARIIELESGSDILAVFIFFFPIQNTGLSRPSTVNQDSTTVRNSSFIFAVFYYLLTMTLPSAVLSCTAFYCTTLYLLVRCTYNLTTLVTVILYLRL